MLELLYILNVLLMNEVNSNRLNCKWGEWIVSGISICFVSNLSYHFHFRCSE